MSQGWRARVYVIDVYKVCLMCEYAWVGWLLRTLLAWKTMTTTAPSSPPHALWGGGGEPGALACIPSLPPSPSPPWEGKDHGGKGRGGGFGVWGSLRARGGSPPKSLPPFPQTPQNYR